MAMVLARRRLERKERATCVTGVNWRLTWKGFEAAVNIIAFFSVTTMASYPRKSDVRLEGIHLLPRIGCNVYEGI